MEDLLAEESKNPLQPKLELIREQHLPKYISLLMDPRMPPERFA